MNFSVSYPLKRHAFQRLGFTYSLTKSTISAFSTASQTFFQTISFRSGIQGTQCAGGHHRAARLRSATSTTPSTTRFGPRSGKEYTAVFQVGRPVRKRALHLAAGGVQELPLDALPDAVGERAQRAGPARAAELCAGIRRRRGAAAEPLLHRRRRRFARLRRSRRNALWLRPQPRDSAVDQSRWHLRSARSHQSAAEPVHPGADSGIWHRLDRRRHEPDDQRRVSHSDCRDRLRSRSSTTSAWTW